MAKRLDFNQKWILITGASSGLGREMARQLAHQFKANLVIVARRKAKLEALKKELESEANVNVKVLVADLTIQEDIDKVIGHCTTSIPLYGVILNAGTTYFGYHKDLDWNKFETIMQTNVMGLLRMVNPLVDYFEVSGRTGGIMIVSSMAAFSPVPYQAAYSATKAFLSNFANALYHELQNPEFSITVYEPGGIVTEMTDDQKFNDLRGWLMPVETAAKEGIYAFQNRKYRYIPGFFNRIGGWFMKALPGKLIAGNMAKIYRKALKKNNK